MSPEDRDSVKDCEDIATPEEQRETARWIRGTAWALYVLLALSFVACVATLGVALGAEGDRIVRSPGGGDYIVLTVKACASRVKSSIAADVQPLAKHVVYHFKNGEIVHGCAIEFTAALAAKYHADARTVYMLFEDGDIITLKKDDFKPMGSAT